MVSDSNRVCQKCGEEDFVHEDFCASCGYDFDSEVVVEKPLFFSVSILKFSVMSIATLGAYQIYWFYNNWTIIRDRESQKINAVARAGFSVIYCYHLLYTIRKAAAHHRIQKEFNPAGLALMYVALYFMNWFPDPVGLIGSFSFAPLLLVQSIVNDINTKATPSASKNDAFSVWNTIAIAAGVSLWALLLIR